MSNEINIEEMERLANAATPGPWKLVGTVEQAGGDYKDIIPTSVSCGAFCQGGTPDRADEADLAFIAAANPSAILALLDRLKKAEAELERANELVADLQAERSFLLAEREEREKQEPVAWLDKSTEERPGDTVWLPDDLQGMGTRGLVPLYAAPPVAAPVQLTAEKAEKADEAIRDALGDAYDCLRVWNAWSYGTMGPDDFSLVAEDSDRVAEIRNAAAAALGFKLEGEQ